MEHQQKVVILYKKRSCVQNLMAALDFTQLNIVSIYKNTFKIVIPFSILIPLIFGIFVGSNFENLDNLDTLNFESISAVLILLPLLYIANISLVFTIIGYILKYYNQHGNTRNFQWSDMEDFSSTFIKTMAINTLTLILFAFGFFLFIMLINEDSVVGIILMIILFIFSIPVFSLVAYPSLLGNCDIFKSIFKGIKLGFGNWGSIFVTAIIASISSIVVAYVFALIIIIFAALMFAASPSVGTYVTLFLSNLISYFCIPFIIICFAFQYFSAVEATEGISLKQKIDDFENL